MSLLSGYIQARELSLYLPLHVPIAHQVWGVQLRAWKYGCRSEELVRSVAMYDSLQCTDEARAMRCQLYKLGWLRPGWCIAASSPSLFRFFTSSEAPRVVAAFGRRWTQSRNAVQYKYNLYGAVIRSKHPVVCEVRWFENVSRPLLGRRFLTR